MPKNDAAATIEAAPALHARNRLERADDAPLDPNSLVGSFFHSGETPGWQGCVVAEPSPSVYLVELFSWMHGGSGCQRLVGIGDMADWEFYDTAKWMGNAYDHGVSQRWEHERAGRDQSPPDDGPLRIVGIEDL